MVLGVLVSGRGSNLEAIIKAIEDGYIKARIGVVISDKKQAYALTRAANHNIPTVVIERTEYKSKIDFEQAIMDQLQEYDVKLVVLAGFMRILGSAFVHSYNGRIMNIHPALLPAFPGLDAQEQALRYGAKVSGCTVHFVDEGMDSGPIILQQAVPVQDDDTVETLSERILKLEHILYSEAIKLYCEGKLEVDGRRVKIRKG